MRSRTNACIAQIDFVFLHSHPCAELLVVVGLQRRPRHNRHGHFMDHAQILEVIEHIECGFSDEGWHGGHANMVNQQSVAIGCGTGYFLGGDSATCAQGVFHHHDSTTQGLAQSLGHVSRQTIGRAARCEGHNNSDGLVFDGKALRPCRAKAQAQQQQTTICNCAHQQSPNHRWPNCLGRQRQPRPAAW